MSVLDRPKREALVFVSLLPLCFTGVSLLLLDCDARLFECAAKGRLTAYKEANP